MSVRRKVPERESRPAAAPRSKLRPPLMERGGFPKRLKRQQPGDGACAERTVSPCLPARCRANRCQTEPTPPAAFIQGAVGGLIPEPQHEKVFQNVLVLCFKIKIKKHPPNSDRVRWQSAAAAFIGALLNLWRREGFSVERKHPPGVLREPLMTRVSKK